MRAILVSVLVLIVPLVPAVPALDVATAAVHTVAATNFAWTPSSLTIAPGDSVEFVNDEGTHTWELADGSEGCTLPCLKTFNEETNVEYRCGIHTSMTGNILVGSSPFVAIAAPLPGATVSGVVEVSGTASHASSDIANVTVSIGAAPVMATLTGAGTSVTWTAELPTTSVSNGPQTIVALATTQSGMSASATVGVVVDNAPTVDLGISGLAAASGALLTNTISFDVANDGNVASGPFEALAEYLYHDMWRVIGLVTVPSIAQGASAEASVVWEPQVPHVGAFQVRVTLDPEARLPDPARANNVGQTSAGWITSALPGVIVTEP